MSRFRQRISLDPLRRPHLLLMWVLLLALIKPLPVNYELPTPREVVTTNPKIGVHTRLTDEVEMWKIQATMSLVRQMGAPWIVEYFPWAYIEPVQGRFSWEHSDAVISHATNQGMQVIARLGMVPEWARETEEVGETTPTYLPNDRFDEFSLFAKEFAARYQGAVREIIIWNEPNLSFEWGYRPVDPAGYVDLLREVYPEVHQVNPDIVVLAGALAPTLEPEGSPAGLNDLLYLDNMYENDAGAYFDALSAHAYGLAFAPDVDPAADLINFRRVELLRGIMDAHGDAHKPIYVTEAGWNDHPRWAWAVSPSLRARYTIEAYAWAEENWAWCPVVAMWMFRTPVPLHNYQDYYAFVTPEFELRPIYGAVRSYAGDAASP